MLAFRKTCEEFNKMMTSCKVDNIIVVREQIDHIVFKETLKDFVKISSYASFYHRKNINVQDNCSTMILNQVSKSSSSRIIMLASLLTYFEAEENLTLSAQSEIKEHSKRCTSEHDDLHEHEIFDDSYLRLI
jgi:hypothetical protein